MRIAIVVGEMSGDILGAGLIRALRQRFPDATFEGIAGPRMLAEGAVSLFPMERLAVMGLVEPLKRLPELLRIRRTLRERYLQDPPDVFIGIDAPDFNLGLALSLRQAGIRTVHYVSPSVWAWRQGRVRKIARAVDLMLTLFPFEAAFYREHRVQVCFVGHPLADDFPLESDAAQARQSLALPEGVPLVALLPGSRRNEVTLLGGIFLQAALQLLARHPDIHFVMPAANEQRHAELLDMRLSLPEPVRDRVHLVMGQSQQAMTASDVVLMASGTTTLEAMLLKRPMVVAYRMAPLTYAIISRMLKTPFVALPNLLAGRALVPEFIQDAATPEALAQAVSERLVPEATQGLREAFMDIHLQLRRNASERAAEAVAALITGAPDGRS